MLENLYYINTVDPNKLLEYLPFSTVQIPSTVLQVECVTRADNSTNAVNSEPLLSGRIGMVDGRVIRIAIFHLYRRSDCQIATRFIDKILTSDSS